MSEQTRPGMNINEACSYNNSAAKRLGWKGKIPRAAVASFPGLAQAENTASFATAVADIQAALGFGPHDRDGKLGSGTWAAILKKFEPVDDRDNYVVHQKRRLHLPAGRGYTTINFDQDGGWDLHKDGDFSKRKSQVRLVVIHWGGQCIRSLCRALRSREISSHFGIERDRVYQILDTGHSAWHAGFVNDFSVGIDICQQPTVEWLGHFKSEGYDVSVVDNPTDRGHKKVLSLNPEARRATRDFVEDLCRSLDIPFRVPRGEDGLSNSGPFYHGVIKEEDLKTRFTGVIGHHHITKGKWDIAPWWQDIFGDLA